MSNTQRNRTYAIIAAIAIGVLAVGATGTVLLLSPSTQDTSMMPESKFIGNTSSGFASAQTIDIQGSANEVPQIFVTGNAFKKVNPDRVSVTLGVETQEKTAQEAAAKNAEIMNAVISALRELGINTNQISTSYYNIYSIYDYERDRVMPYPQNPILVGYRVTNTITVTMQANADVGKVIDAAVNAGANQVQGVSYFVSEEVQRQISSELIEEAVLNAKMKAEKALAPLNMQIVGVKSMNINDVFYPMYRFDRAVMEASAPTPILPSDQQVSMSASVTFIIGSK